LTFDICDSSLGIDMWNLDEKNSYRTDLFSERTN
jgi:hypothetical protein